MLRKLFLMLSVAVCFGFLAALANAGETVKISRIAGGDLATYPIDLANRLGYYSEEGLDVEVVPLDPDSMLSTLLNGQIHYGLYGSIAVHAAKRRLPLRIVFAFVSGPQYSLMVRPEIKTPQDLSGKKIAVSSPFFLPETILKEYLERHQVYFRMEDLIPTGASGDRLTALLNGWVDAAVLAPPRDYVAEQKGFRRLAGPDDLAQVPMDVFVATTERIRQKPDELRKLFRGTLRTIHWARQNPEKTKEYLMKDFRFVKDAEAAERYYQLGIKIWNPRGWVPDEKIQLFSRIIGGPEVTPEKLADFRIAKEVDREPNNR